MGASPRASQTSSNCGLSAVTAETEMRPPVMPGHFERWCEELRIEEWADKILGPEPVVLWGDGRTSAKAATWKARQAAFYELMRYMFDREQMIRAEGEVDRLRGAVAMLSKPL